MVARGSKSQKSNEVAEVMSDGELAGKLKTLSDDAALAIRSVDDLMAAVAAEYGNGVEMLDVADVVGDGFVLLDRSQKDRLVSVPFVIVDWRFIDSDKFQRDGKPLSFATIRVITDSGQKFRINDGSTGIYQQLKTVTERTGRNQLMKVAGGLTRSDYEVEIDGVVSTAQTYYLNTGA